MISDYSEIKEDDGQETAQVEPSPPVHQSTFTQTPTLHVEGEG